MKHLRPWSYAHYVHNTCHKYEKLGPRANKHTLIKYSKKSKGYVMYSEHTNGEMTQIESHDITFIEIDFSHIG